MVANNFFGLDLNSNTKSPLRVLDFAKTSKVVLDSEKKATSVPDIIADNAKRHNKTITSIIMYQGNELSSELMGSRSNVIRYNL